MLLLSLFRLTVEERKQHGVEEGVSAAAAMGEGAAAELDIEENNSHIEMTIQELRVTNEDLIQ